MSLDELRSKWKREEPFYYHMDHNAAGVLFAEIDHLQATLDDAGKLADWINRARPIITELMSAYERRVRSDCKTPEELAARPWECMEWRAAADLLRDQPVAAVEVQVRS